MVFRFDDVCSNANIDHCNKIAELFHQHYPNAKILYAVSPLCARNCGERCYPKIWNAYSDYRLFYNMDYAEVPQHIPQYVTTANHGLVHVDHRLLNYHAQEMSILTGAALAKSTIFIPPFNKWNKDTEAICREAGIELIKFEDGWRCLEYEKFEPDKYDRWYLHAREMSIEKIKEMVK